jgi:DNA-binding transcriptional LysR family regulator
MSDLVEFRHLKYIVAVAETANFTRAAERLFLAQPSLSKQIKDLEDEIGFPIFVRNRDGVRITPAGQMIIAYAHEALAERMEILTMARAVHKGEVAPFRLGFSPFVNPELLEFFRDVYGSLFPNCPTHLSGGNSTHILQRLEQENLDAAPRLVCATNRETASCPILFQERHSGHPNTAFSHTNTINPTDQYAQCPLLSILTESISRSHRSK